MRNFPVSHAKSTPRGLINIVQTARNSFHLRNGRRYTNARKNILTKEQTIKKLEELNKIGRYSRELYEHFKGELK